MLNTIPVERYAGSVVARGSYGLPSWSSLSPTTKVRLVLLVAFGIAIVLHAFGLLDFTFLAVGAGPVTLAQAQKFVTDAVDRNVINEFRKSSEILDRIPFDQAVNPAGGGATLTYGYTRQTTQRGAAFRAINAEYTPTAVDIENYTVTLKPLGGSYQVDRVIARMGPGPLGAEVALQSRALIEATSAYFAEQAILGDSAVTTDGFDGLNKALVGTTTEYNADSVDDWTVIDTQLEALQAAQKINAWLALLDGPPSALLMNGTAKAWFSMISALSGQNRTATNSFGDIVETYRGIPLLDLGARAGSSADVIATYGGVNEVQRITITGTPTGGTFTLTFQGNTTGAIAYNASAANVVTALEAVLGTGAVTATGGALPGATVDVTFKGQYAGVNVALMTASAAGLTGGTPVIAITVVTAGGTGTGTGATGLTDLYAVRFGIDGFHAVAVTGPLVRTWLPDFSTAGAVKTGEAELGPAAVVLKRSRAAGVYRNVKVV